ncbi:hypothetical protein BaRGS_00010373 [Batillaria attramentaria]|uniref:ATP-grasp domain-containing protein n=1 Tax=Batillaria attramentaria TaxID=370345 RepID=A0ABD0LFQ1_9CAEN
MRVIVLHDNPEWFEPIRTAFSRHGVDVEEWVSDETAVDITKPPPADAVYYNRCSSSAHTRGRHRSLDQAMTILRWLHQHGRVVVNGLIAAQLENSKALQYMTTVQYGIGVPRSLLTAKPTLEVIEGEFGKSTPFLVKPDRGGRGTYIRYYGDADAFQADPQPLESITGLYVVQQFVKVECQRYLYTSLALPESGGCFDPNMCPCELPKSRFRILTDFSHPILDKLDRLFKGTGLENGAVEFIMDEEGVPRVIDINTNTAYNRDAEVGAGVEEGWESVTRYVINRLRQAEASVPNGDSVAV